MSTHRGLRWREDTGWEMRCASCADQRRQSFWPLTHEFWAPERGLGRCRACWNERLRLRRQRTVSELVERGEALREHKRLVERRRYNRDWMRRKRAA